MSESTPSSPGRIVWQDLTVPHAEEVRDFYKDVIGWTASDHDMETYADYNMHRPDTNEIVTGVCHARGMNADIPAQWIIYVTVADMTESVRKVNARGGAVVNGPRLIGDMMIAVIRDPAGAVLGLIQENAASGT